MPLSAGAIRSVFRESERGRHRGRASMTENSEATRHIYHTNTHTDAHTREDLRSLAVK